MSLHYKLIIPLIDNGIKLSDLSAQSGFVNIFSEDINRPYLDNHIFLLYSSTVLTNEAFEREARFKTLKSYYNMYEVEIGGMAFVLYAFVILNKSIKNIMSGSVTLSIDDKNRINAFWNLSDRDVNTYMLNPLYVMYSKFVNNVVPEEDYRPDNLILENEKRGAFLVRSAPL